MQSTSHYENSITKVTQLITRGCGKEVKIVATAFYCYDPMRSIGVDVFTRNCSSDNWKLCSDRPHLEWRDMSVDQYVKHGRSEQLQAASPGEILKVVSMIGKPNL